MGGQRNGLLSKAFHQMSMMVTLMLMVLFNHLQETLAQCDFGFDSRITKEGNFSSPRYPSDYPGGVTCRYAFRGGEFEGLRISFHAFELEEPYKGGCLADYVDITTIDNSERNERHLVGRFCGTLTPSPVLTMQPTAEVIFRTNWAIQRRGFHATYKFLHEKDTPAPTSSPGRKNCGGFIGRGDDETAMTTTGGILTSPGYPHFIPDNLDCVWLIRVESPSRVHVRLEELQFHGSLASCDRMELSFNDGYTGFAATAMKMQSLCGDLKYYIDVDDRAILSPRNRLLVRLQVKDGIKPDQVHGIVGFKLVWTAVTFSDINECPGFICRRSNYCLRSSPTGSCTSSLAFCIANELACDGISNCSENDDSDEASCYMRYLLSVISVAGPALLLVTIAITTCLVIRRRRQQRVKKSCSQMQSLTMHLRQLEHSPSSSSNRLQQHHHHHHQQQQQQHPTSMSSYNQPCDLLTPTFSPEMRNGLSVAATHTPYDAYGGTTHLTMDDDLDDLDLDCSTYKGFNPTQV